MSHSVIRSSGTPEQYNAKAAEAFVSWTDLPPTAEEYHSEENSRAMRELAGMEVPGWDSSDYEAALAANGLTVDLHPVDMSLYNAVCAKYGWTE